jgi:hypothetical protein
MFSLDDNNYKPKMALGFDPAANPLTKEQIERNKKTRTLIFQIQNLESLQADRYKYGVLQEMPGIPGRPIEPIMIGIDDGGKLAAAWSEQLLEPRNDLLPFGRPLVYPERETDEAYRKRIQVYAKQSILARIANVLPGESLDKVGAVVGVFRRGA